jgi:hypothetical protein
MMAMFMAAGQLAGDTAMAKAFLSGNDAPPPANPTKTTNQIGGEASKIVFGGCETIA